MVNTETTRIVFYHSISQYSIIMKDKRKGNIVEQPGWYIIFCSKNGIVGPVYSEYRVDTIKTRFTVKKYIYDESKENLIRTYKRNKDIL